MEVALAFFSAGTQAVVHAMLKSARDKLVVRGVAGVAAAGIVAPFLPFTPPPGGDLVPWLALSVAVHAVYQITLLTAYERNDFGVAYPLARGVAPVATALLGLLLLGDELTALGFVGIAAVSLGLLVLAAGGRPDRAGLVAAIAAGLLTTAYTLIDAESMRRVPTAATFIVYFFLLDGLAMAAIALALRRRGLARLVRAERARGGLTGGLMLVTYGAALVALRTAPAGLISAVRETSVVFGAVIARLFLKEPLGLRRVLGSVIVAAGAVIAAAG